MESLNVDVSSSTYNFIELIGTSPDGFEEAVKNAMDTASKKITNMRIAKVVELDARLEKERIIEYRAKIRLSFKHEIEPETL